MSGDVDFDQIVYTVDGSTATIVLNRPERLNAFTETMMSELLTALDAADDDDQVRAIVVTGAGRAFCAGADMSSDQNVFDVPTSADGPADGFIDGVPRDRGGRLTLRMMTMRKPLIAAINGPAVGIGVTMTLAMDVRIASASARMGFVFTRRGLVPEGASTWFLPRIVGISRALQWTLQGKMVDAEEALASGLITEVHPDDDLLPAARSLASSMSEGTSAIAVAQTRRLMWSSLGTWSPLVHHRLDSKVNHYLKQQGETAEGVQAFLEKRPAQFPLAASTELPDDIVTEWPWVEP